MIDIDEKLEGIEARKVRLKEVTDVLLDLYKDKTKRKEVEELLKKVGHLQTDINEISECLDEIIKEFDLSSNNL